MRVKTSSQKTKLAPARRGPPARPTLRRVPATMRAIAIDRYGGPQVLTLHELPVPQPGPTEVLISVQTAGVAGWDADIRGGWSPGGGRVRFPLGLGTDGSGTIAQLGYRVRRFKAGDRVYAYVRNSLKGGFYAEYAAVPVENVAPTSTP